MDEVGRGTSTTDGISIAYATLEYIHSTICCKALFATHYHELADLAASALTRVRNCHTAIEKNDDGSFVYIHKVMPGICRESHGLFVAKMVGLPESVIQQAQRMAEAVSVVKQPLPILAEGSPESVDGSELAKDSSVVHHSHYDGAVVAK
ncbi:MutS protein 1 [Spiromyces aspiralis]|uniref:MutS protein 1 n=1 Tax=Spiromyces aspiralis TaxID=68401 RepID=A0ACC1HRQ3_9FUNG|nr:MutS protein 1 [Spiromyces aspiralis]